MTGVCVSQTILPNSNLVPNANADNYYRGVFWNDYKYVVEEINRRISGEKLIPWDLYFAKKVEGRRFKKALIINCGNGWVDRQLCKLGVFDEAVGVDFLDNLLVQARERAVGLPLRYYQMDTNNAIFPEGDYDLVVNYAALHHNAFLDRVIRKIDELLPEDGYFVNYDYVGPHRNQYSTYQWLKALWLNRTLPISLRQQMKYPHLPTMMHIDPTEAIHSELILTHLKRYFHIVDHKHSGGALAYIILTHNVNFARASLEEQLPWLEHVMNADGKFVQRHPEASLFDYILARPNKDVLTQTAKLAQWEKEECSREEYARKCQGLYYSHTLISRMPLLRGWE
jgi:SAM-dependent methyltransferase